MDSQKDLQRTDGLTKFLDYQTLKSNPFGDNRVGERIYKRAERIASAIVLLTNHIDPADTIRVEVRQGAVDLLSMIISIRDEMRSPNSARISDLKMGVRKAVSLIRLLGVAGHVSLQNADIVIEALDELLNFLQVSRRSNLSESVNINRDDLIDLRETHRHVERAPERVSVSEQVAGTVADAPGHTKQSTVSTRAQAILEVLRHHGESGIREVAANLPEYSEKMIQRELVDLVTAGRVKKIGLKRWSRYTYIEGQ